MVAVHADLSPERRLHATGGQARNLYAELMKNISTRTKPEGNALSSVVERFITEARKQSDSSGETVDSVISQQLDHLSELVGGYDFAKVVSAYWKGHEQDNRQLKSDAVRWFRGEFTTKTEARSALGVRTIVDDADMYDHLKLMSLFVRQAGYQGLLVNLDETVALYKLPSQKARVSNYEKILHILNDCLQGSAGHIGFILGGTPDFLLDRAKVSTAMKPCNPVWPTMLRRNSRTCGLLRPNPSPGQSCPGRAVCSAAQPAPCFRRGRSRQVPGSR